MWCGVIFDCRCKILWRSLVPLAWFFLSLFFNLTADYVIIFICKYAVVKNCACVFLCYWHVCVNWTPFSSSSLIQEESLWRSHSFVLCPSAIAVRRVLVSPWILWTKCVQFPPLIHIHFIQYHIAHGSASLFYSCCSCSVIHLGIGDFVFFIFFVIRLYDHSKNTFFDGSCFVWFLLNRSFFIFFNACQTWELRNSFSVFDSTPSCILRVGSCWLDWCFVCFDDVL